MTNKRDWLYGILLFGSLWGGAEAFIGSSMDGLSSVIPRSVVLAFVAVLFSSVARRMMPAFGTTVAVGVVAAAMKLISMPTILACQFAAVIGQAAILECFFTASERLDLGRRFLPMSILMVAASYLNSLAFSFSQAYVFRNNWWLDRGVSGLLAWSFTTGSAAAVASWLGYAVSIPLASRLRRVMDVAPANGVVVLRAGALALSAVIWIAVAL